MHSQGAVPSGLAVVNHTSVSLRTNLRLFWHMLQILGRVYLVRWIIGRKGCHIGFWLIILLWLFIVLIERSGLLLFGCYEIK